MVRAVLVGFFLIASGICFYKVYMYSALAAAPGLNQQELRNLGNSYFLLGAGAFVVGVAIYALLGRRNSREDEGSGP